jgi:hypothetical protein
MRNPWIVSAFVTFGVLAFTAIRLGAQAAQPTSPTYTWSAQLVALDAQSHVMTVKAPVRGDQAHTELPKFMSGDRILLTWTGYDTLATDISRAVRFNPASNWSQPFAFPVEFVSYDAGSQYLTFKVKAPETSLETVKSVKLGEWITTTARHRPTTENDVIAGVAPYVNTTAASTTH